MIWLRQSTAREVAVGPFIDDTDGKTRETALTITSASVLLKKNEDDWAAKNEATSLVHESNGWYRCLLNSTDTNTLGVLRLEIAATGALAVWETLAVVTANVWDTYFGTDNLDISVIQWLGTAVTAGTAGVPNVDMTRIANAAVSTSTAQLGVNAVNAGGTAWGSGAITAGSIATGAITNVKFAAGAIDAAAIATDAIGAAELAADAVTEIANGVWSLDATGQQTQGTFGQAVGDPVAGASLISRLPNATPGAANGVLICGTNAAVTITTGLTTTFTGNLTGSVGSVTGAVGSVTGSVASVTGAVGSVTGLTASNLDATVSSRLAPTTAGRTLDVSATGEAGVDWTNVGGQGTTVTLSGTTIGTASAVTGLTASNLDTTVSSRLATAGYTAPPSAATVSTAVWTEALPGSYTSGQAGYKLNAAGAAGDPWSTAVPGAYGAGTAGNILGSNLNATVSSRLPTSSYTTPPTAAENADAVWDEPTAGHIIPGTFGQGSYVILSGTSPSGSSDSTHFTLAAGGPATDNLLNSNVLVFTEGPGAGQARVITGYVASTGVCAFITALRGTLPTSATKYMIVPADALSYGWTVSTIGAAVWNISIPGAYGAGTAGNILGNRLPALESGRVPAALDTANIDAILDRPVDGTVTPRQAFRIVLAALAGKVSGAATTTITIRSINDDKDRIVATVDVDGNRSALTFDLT